ncbi:minor capsid protein [Shouchella hunanensis]|uniref:Minor capsid protein n=1 Tax=Shouchella hunanensis TaxID=766894 RepID=A0ABY7W8D9_9BACI|nr:minor capsid protein [Shouchella hunanensis]WDF02955.1 minor capsid protein [Shouchella hunanensis]
MTHVKVTIDTKNIGPKLLNAVKGARPILTQQVVKDSNNFIPFDTGNAQASSLRTSNFEEGQAVWDTPYIRKIYYGLRMNFSKDVNPLAGPLWFERAHAAYGSQWSNMAERAVRSNL